MSLILRQKTRFSPYQLSGSVLKAWWSAQDHGSILMTDDGSGLISNWKSRAATYDAITATTTARPTWGATSFNSAYPGLTFDGTANCFVTTTLTNFPTGANAGEIWAVGSCTTNASTTHIFTYGGAFGTAVARSLRKAPAASNRFNFSDGSASASVLNPPTTTSPFVGRANFTGTAMRGWINGTENATDPVTIATLNTGTTRLRIAANNTTGAANFGQMVGADFLILSGVLSTADAQKMEGYFAWTYGFQASLPDTHPYQRFRP